MAETFYCKLAKIQAELNAPKGQYNSFGGYHYRSCEDILNAVKPLLDGLFLSISDEVVQLGDRYYIKATATISDGKHTHSASALAREALTKKGMDDAQVTGSTSSYARKYCLNGLFGIDDTKDADATNDHGKGGQNANQRNGQQNNRSQNNRGGQQQNNRGNQTANRQQQKPAATPDQILASFTEVAAKTADRNKLENLYSRAWKALDGNTEHQSKCHQVMNIRVHELKQQNSAAA